MADGGDLAAPKVIEELIDKFDSDPTPIRTIDFSDSADVARHDPMVALVEQMLAQHKQLPYCPHAARADGSPAAD